MKMLENVRIQTKCTTYKNFPYYSRVLTAPVLSVSRKYKYLVGFRRTSWELQVEATEGYVTCRYMVLPAAGEPHKLDALGLFDGDGVNLPRTTTHYFRTGF